jgi:hypothetical protein
MRSKSGEGDVAVSGPKAKSFRSRTMGSFSLTLGISNGKSQISNLAFEICDLQSRRACPRSPGLDFRSCLGGFAMDSLIRSVR